MIVWALVVVMTVIVDGQSVMSEQTWKEYRSRKACEESKVDVRLALMHSGGRVVRINCVERQKI